ncbi:MAG: serine O-acetyltransferase [Candidatus Omnitrophica bacterium CG11_big_fil_rev_8_21_14_0_20_64_10]|nr:MAG: serine O-acetyltransferase [Candidatus Omnitrophica bacterium CG11_big_fil_rev_8_21_14_0_20_64_10]
MIARIGLRGEIRAALERDPAARNGWEVLLLYPSVWAIGSHRLAHGLNRIGLKFPARLLSQVARFLTGIEIHPGARIGRGFFIDHGMGVVIGETAQVGDNVTLFQGVTLGGTGKEKGKRHPTLGNNVVVGAGAKVLGSFRIGNNVRIGANAVVVREVPDDAVVVGVPGRVVKESGRYYPGINLDHTALPDPLTQALDRLQNEIDHIEGEIRKHHQGQR